MHTGAHKLNNALGQVLIAQRLGKRRIIAETGAGQHGVATATVCARFGLECVVYMGSEDIRRQAPNVERMGLLGAEVRPVEFGTRTLKEATSEAIRDWIANVETTHYVIGSCVGPAPYPELVRELQRVIGREAREQFLAVEGRLPEAVVACVGGGSNAIGMFYDFIEDDGRAADRRRGGGRRVARHRPRRRPARRALVAARRRGRPDLGRAFDLRRARLPGVGPEHAWLRDSGRAEYVACTDDEAVAAFHRLCETEGIVPALESSHALARALDCGAELVLVCLSGRGDKDLAEVLRRGVRVTYDAAAAAAFYDEYGEREWTRFEDGRTSAISLATHLHYLRRFVVRRRPCARYRLRPGAVHAGARARSARASSLPTSRRRQLELHRANGAGRRASRHVSSADVVDLSHFERDAFDAVVCYGRPALVRAATGRPYAVAELARRDTAGRTRAGRA